MIISVISLLKIINVISEAKHKGRAPDRNIFLGIAASVAIAVAADPSGIERLLANGSSTFPIKDNPVFSNSSRSLPRNPLDYLMLWDWVFDNFILADEPFGIIDNNIWRNCQSYFSTTFYSKFNLLSYELDNFTFKMLYCIKAKNKIRILLQFLVKNLKVPFSLLQ